MKAKLPLKDAAALALLMVERLKPYCERIEIAGSIRRRKPEIGDIELLAIPKYEETDTFGKFTENHTLDLLDWSDYGKFIKGGHKYKQITLFKGINLDLFICTRPKCNKCGAMFTISTEAERLGNLPSLRGKVSSPLTTVYCPHCKTNNINAPQFGVLFLIRTGSAEFSHRFVTSKQQGGMLPSYLKVKDGAIWSHNHIVPTPEESDVFDLAGVEFIEPERR